MLSTRKNRERIAGRIPRIRLLAAILLTACIGLAQAAEEPGYLTVIPDSGLILLDYDTLNISVESTVEISPGDHLLSFFPFHSERRWAHRYIDYNFNVGSGGRRTIDLTRREIFSLRSNPQSAEIHYRGKFIGRTPGDYMFLLGAGDSLRFRLEGYEEKVLFIDETAGRNHELVAVLHSRSPIEYAGEIEPLRYSSPLRPLIEPKRVLSLGTGATLLALGVHFNKKADRHYTRYLQLAGATAREKAYQDAIHNDRLSKYAFIAGDISIGVFGYFLIRDIIFRNRGNAPGREKQRTLSLDMSPSGTAISYRF